MKKIKFYRIKILFDKSIEVLKSRDKEFWDYVYVYLTRNNFQLFAAVVNRCLVFRNSLSAMIRYYKRVPPKQSLIHFLLKNNKRFIYKLSSLRLLEEALKLEHDLSVDDLARLISLLESSSIGFDEASTLSRIKIAFSINKAPLDFKGNLAHGRLKICPPPKAQKNYIETTDVTFKSPILIPEEARVDTSFKVPDLGIHVIENVYVVQNEIIFDEFNYYNFDDAAIPRGFQPAGEIQSLVEIKDSKDDIGLNFRFQKVVELEEVVTFAGRCSNNYFHWMIEYIPRLHLVASLQNKKVSVFIPKGLWPQQIEALSLVGNFDFIQLESEAIYKVKKVIVPTYHTRIYDDLRIPFNLSAMLSPALMQSMALRFKNNVTLMNKGGRKIFLSRKHQFGRTLENIADFEVIFSNHGFEIIYPESLSFIEQIKLFHSSDVVVGPGGATFANLVFCRPGTLVFVFLGDHNKGFSLFSNLAEIFGLKYFSLPGAPISNTADKLELLSSNYYRDPNEAITTISSKIASIGISHPV